MARSGLDEFKELLSDFRGLSIWAVGAGVSVPFVAAVLDIAPPWPKGIAPVTAIIELLVLMLIFQFFASANQKRVNRMLIVSLTALAILALTYLFVFSRYTFVIPTNGARDVKGFVCTEDAKLVYGDQCNEGDKEMLASVEYEAPKLWKSWSIEVMTLLLVLIWILSFCSLSFFIGLFIVFQKKRKIGAGGGRRQKTRKQGNPETLSLRIVQESFELART